MVILKFQAKSFKKMEDPTSRESERTKYVCYAQAKTIPLQLNEWMQTNPREQKMTTNVAKNIRESLKENENFHELNRGIVLSAEKVNYANKTGTVEIQLDDPQVHGNIDGGHTLRAIFELNEKQIMDEERYVFMEIFTGIESPVELASARNTSVQVDLKSIEELQKSFETLKDIMKDLKFSNSIAYKMNEHYNVHINAIDDREILNTLKKVNLLDEKDKKFKKYSLDMKQKLGIAEVLMENPDIMILDEPFNGLEEESANKIRKILLEEKEKGKLIIIATHIKEDIDELCNVIFHIDKGKIK